MQLSHSKVNGCRVCVLVLELVLDGLKIQVNHGKYNSALAVR